MSEHKEEPMPTTSVEERLQRLETQVGALNLMAFASFACLKSEEVFAMLRTIKEALRQADDPKAREVLTHIELIEGMLRSGIAGTTQILLG